MWVEPKLNADNAAEVERLGILGRMLELGPCIIEPFSEPPDIMDVRSCMKSQSDRGMSRHREARWREQPEPPWPNLWIISSGRPQTIIDAMELREMPGWPTGFWQRREFDAFYLVDVHALPQTPDTLFLRLLGRRRTFSDAVGELFSQPESVWPRSVLDPLLIAFSRNTPRELFEEEDEDALCELEAVYAELERRILGQGREEGERLGLIEGIEMLCAALDVELTQPRRAQLASSDIAQLKATLAAIGTMRRWPETDSSG